MTNKVIDPIIYQAEINYKAEYFHKNNPTPGETLLKALDFCMQANISIPDWLRTEYRKSYRRYQQIISAEPLVTAFRTDPDMGKHRKSKQIKNKHYNSVWYTVMWLHLKEGKGISQALFDEVAERHAIKGLGGSTVRDWYYEMSKALADAGITWGVMECFVKPELQKK